MLTSNWGQLEEIIRGLGLPSAQDARAFAPESSEQLAATLARFTRDQCRPRPWGELLPAYAGMHDALALPDQMLKYDPAARCPPGDALVAPVFDGLPEEAGILPLDLFDFSEEELRGCRPETTAELGRWAERRQRSRKTTCL